MGQRPASGPCMGETAKEGQEKQKAIKQPFKFMLICTDVDLLMCLVSTCSGDCQSVSIEFDLGTI